MGEVCCVRIKDIADPENPYRQESHACFVCGYEFLPNPDHLCEVCNWLTCPNCGGCKCNLTKHDQEWVDRIRLTVCQRIIPLAILDINSLSHTDNPNVRIGLTAQLRFCRSWARQKINEE